MRDAFLTPTSVRRPSVDELMAAIDRLHRRKLRRKVYTALTYVSLGLGLLLWAGTR